MKKRIAALAASLGVPYWVLAGAGILIGLLVVALGAFIIIKLYYTIKIVLPDNPKPTNDVQTTYYYDHSSAVQTQPLYSYDTIQNPNLAGGFPLQYGVSSSDGLPWIEAGTNEVCTTTNTGYLGVIYTFDNDTNCIDVVVATGGALYRVTYTATNDFTTNYPLTVVIQSSSNLVDWHAILVDGGCVPDAVANFTDTNATTRSNFYRVFYQ